MSELGQRLKNARQEKDMSLEEVQEATKIQKRYLAAIEAGDFDQLPGNFYTRAFIKSYADAVGLYGEELLEEYKGELPKSNSEMPENLPPRKSRSSVSNRSSKWTSILPTLLVGVLIIGVIAIFWYFLQNGSSDTRVDNPEPDSEEIVSDENKENQDTSKEDQANEDADKTDSTAADENQQQQEEKPAFTLKKVDSTNDEQTFQISGADKIEVKLEASGNSWTGIKTKSSGKGWFKQVSLSAGKSSTIDLTNEENIYFRLGSSPNTSIYVNGEKLDIPVKPDVQNVYLKKGE
ncbi:helix-turn-helix domain-containing protein [Pseudalkalibacillus caeni]|uniref:Helix-turn-helix domain-containing protein n=1 Tax=Exobacillus caeni TaxID=2574798 RepID=A0A5R9F4X4_9BACL|nr:RodZ domain-containing protein [Pseudalkalibacillus caeni]TLS37396.1 helix-turn-helix domain-containing protein [Pseudalkalibacillus caeni]